MSNQPFNDNDYLDPSLNPLLLDKRQLATKFGVTDRTVENWMSRGDVPYFKIRKIVLFDWSEVLHHLNENHHYIRDGKSVKKAKAFRVIET